jgi:pentatricopeptide repeat protein
MFAGMLNVNVDDAKNFFHEAVSLCWVEMLMFSLALVTYVLFTGNYIGKKLLPLKEISETLTPDSSPRSSSPRTPARIRTPNPAEGPSPSDVAKQVAMIRARSRENDLDGAMQVFRKLESTGMQTTLVYNALLDACVQCSRIAVALRYFKEMKERNLVDVVSYNTLLKAYLRNGQVAKAHALLAEMNEAGIESNQVTYNEMLNALVTVRDRKLMWELVGDMRAKGIHANSVTCSIILKSLTGHSAAADVKQAMELIDNMEEDMDEVLFASVIEACVRVGQLDLLSAKLQSYAARGGLAGLSAPTYGSMIKAYGRAHDIERVLELWADMRRRCIRPTSITLGCMVDALVTNGRPDEAHQLVKEIREEPDTRDVLNTVVYSTLLKGFAQSKAPEKVQTVYDEMLDAGIPCNTVSYNTMIDANARTGRMDRASELFQAMSVNGVYPDVITYSTMVKGFCQSGDIDQGFEVLRNMIASGKHEPDEILYNSLLDGCAKQHRVDDALKLVEDMGKTGVRPSNFTLSILVKLLGRSRRLNQAFSMVEETCKNFDFQANVHVYTCLIYACFQNRQMARALKLHDTMITEAGVEPDARTYAVLVRGCVGVGSFEKAAEAVRAAYRLSPTAMVQPSRAPGVEPRALEEVMSALSASPNAERLAVPLLADLKALGVNVETTVYSRAAATSMSRAGRNNSNPEQAVFATVGNRGKKDRSASPK